MTPAAQTPGLAGAAATSPPGLPSSTWPLQSSSRPSQTSALGVHAVKQTAAASSSGVWSARLLESVTRYWRYWPTGLAIVAPESAWYPDQVPSIGSTLPVRVSIVIPVPPGTDDAAVSVVQSAPALPPSKIRDSNWHGEP